MAQQASIDDLLVGLDRGSEVPLGTQLAWKVRSAIAVRHLRAGDRLPGVRELATAAHVNVNTVRAVYARLAEQGIVVSEHGRGTFVADAADRTELVQLAERVARDARLRGVDPRDLAAVLYADASPPPRSSARAPSEADRRRALRDDIARLDREHVELEAELATLDEPPVPAPAPAPRARRPTGARLMSAAELDVARDDLADKVAELRQRLAAVHERERARAAPRSVSGHAPESVIEGGRWTLRWTL